MKKHTRKTNYKEKGITLLALVVIIIVLLILAGVTLNLVLGQNGLIRKAQLSSNTMAEATRNEATKMAEMADVIARLSQNRDDNTDYSELLYNYYKDMYYDQIVNGINNIDGTDANWLFEGEDEENHCDYIEYRGGIYKIIYIDDSGNGVRAVKKVDTSNVDFNTFGEYQIDGIDVLIIPNDPDRLIHVSYDGPDAWDDCYYIKENGDLDLERKLIEWYYSYHTGYFYDMSGKRAICLEDGVEDFDNCYYLKSNGDLDLERKFTKGYYFKDNSGLYSYYDTTGKKVNVVKVDGLQEYIGYYLKENGDLNLNKPFTEGYFSHDTGSVYDISGKKVEVACTYGLQPFEDYYYLKENGDLDLDKPFEEGYFSWNTESIYDTSGKKVNVIEVDGLQTFSDYYYLKDNGDMDYFTKGYYSWDTRSHYDQTGKKVDVVYAEGPETYTDVYYIKENGDLDYERPFRKGYHFWNSFFDETGKKVEVARTRDYEYLLIQTEWSDDFSGDWDDYYKETGIHFTWTLEVLHYGESIQIRPEYNPKMRIQGIDHEYDLTSCIWSWDDKKIHLDDIVNEFEWGDIKTATVTLTVNGHELEWTGHISAPD